VIAAVAVLTGLFGWEIRELRPEVALRDLMPADHPFARIDARLREDFGAGQTNLLALRVRSGDVLDPGALAKIRRLTEGVARLPGVEPSSVLSLTSPNVKALRVGPDDEVEVGPLVDAIPADAAGQAALRDTVAAHPMFVGNLLTPDRRGALIAADFVEPVAVEPVTQALEALAAAERDAGTEIFVGGQSPALAALQDATRGIAPLLLLALLVVGLVHYEAFRTFQGVLLPLVTACLSVIWSLGITRLAGLHLTPWTALTTILVLSIAAGHAVQILKRYYECYAALGDTRLAVQESLERVGPVMVTAGFVAAAGFASLATFGVPAVRDFGLMAACGIASALLIELTFIPAVRVLLPPPKRFEIDRESSQHVLGAAIERLAAGVIARPRGVLAACVAAVAVVALGIGFIDVNSAFRSWFGADAPVIVADRTIRDAFTGTSTIRLRVAADEDGALLDPAAMRGIAALEERLGAEPDVTATLSVADSIRQMNRAMHGDDPAAWTVPDSRDLIAQYLLLFDADSLARLITPDQRAAAVYALARSDSVSWVEGLFGALAAVARDTMPPGVRVEIAGGELAQAAANNRTVVREKLENTLQVSAVIFALSALVFRSFAAGLLVLAPLACAVLVNLGVMGWLGTDLSFATATYTSMGVSLGADFAIYLLFRLREEMRSRPLEGALRETLRTSGRAIFFVASAIAAGYATLLLSDFLLWRQLGAYVALMMASSALATLTVLPALLLISRPRFLHEKEPPPVAGG
jgi:predicted RND superfamily exporter protein